MIHIKFHPLKPVLSRAMAGVLRTVCGAFATLGAPWRRTAPTIGAIALACTAGISGAQSPRAPQKLPTTQLSAGMYLIQAEVANTPSQREIGLMHRPSMPTNNGMIFVFQEPGVQCFWMRNTLLPLSAAFIDDEGRIVNIEDMAPQTEDSHCSKKPVRYVLEMNQGWFAKRGVKAGSKLSGGPFPAATTAAKP